MLPDHLGTRHVEVLDALEQIFLTEGVRAVTIGELASRIKCSRSTLYEIAPTKRELFHDVLLRWSTRAIEKAKSTAERYDHPLECLFATQKAMIEGVRLESGAFLADVQADPVARDLLDSHLKRQNDLICSIFQRGVSRGIFRDFSQQFIADLFITLVRHYQDPELQKKLRMSTLEAYTELQSLIIDGLISRSGPRSPD